MTRVPRRSISIAPPLYFALRDVCAREGIAVAQVIEQLTRRFLAGELEVDFTRGQTAARIRAAAARETLARPVPPAAPSQPAPTATDSRLPRRFHRMTREEVSSVLARRLA